MSKFDIGNGIPTSARPTIAVPKIFGAVIAPVVAIGGVHSVPKGIDTPAGSQRASERRELPVGIRTSAVSFDAASEPMNLATLEPITPV